MSTLDFQRYEKSTNVYNIGKDIFMFFSNNGEKMQTVIFNKQNNSSLIFVFQP